jgi:hypothetical protein
MFLAGEFNLIARSPLSDVVEEKAEPRLGA